MVTKFIQRYVFKPWSFEKDNRVYNRFKKDNILMFHRATFQINYIWILDIQISSQHDAKDIVRNMQTNWLISLIRVFKVKGLFKMTSCKYRQFLNPLPLSITQCHKIYIIPPLCSELWVTKRGQNDDIKLKHFELQTIWKQQSINYNIYNNSQKGSMLFSIAYGF